MAGIGASKFYKKLVPCVPMNNKDSEGSSDSGDCCENVEKASKLKKKVRKGCLVPIEDDSDSSDASESSSHSSELRWKRNNVEDGDIVVPPSDHSSENMTTVSSTCISPMSNISSLVGSVTTLPPSPRPVSKNEAPKSKRMPISKKPLVTVQDRYTQKKPIERFETQHPTKNVVSVRHLPSRLPPVNPCRKMLFQSSSRVTISLQQSNICTSSNRAKKLLEAASPRKLESSASSAVNHPSPQKILAQRKRTLRPTQTSSENKENSKNMKPATAASTPSITHTHFSSSGRSSTFSRNNNQFVPSEKSKKNIDAVSKERDTGAVNLLEASSPRKPLSCANNVVNNPSPQKILALRKRTRQSTQTSSQKKENSKMMKPFPASTPCIPHTHSSSSSLSSTFSRNNKSELAEECGKILDSVSNERNTSRVIVLDPRLYQSKGSDSKDCSRPKDIPCSLPPSHSFDDGLCQIPVASSPISPTRGQEASPGLSPITPGTSMPPSATRGLLRKGIQSSISQCNNTSAEKSGRQDIDVKDNLQSISPHNCVSSPDMFEENESPGVHENFQCGTSPPLNARLGALRKTTPSATEQANTQSTTAKTNACRVGPTSKPSQASTSKKTNTRMNPHRAARADRDYCPSPSASETNHESEDDVVDLEELEDQIHQNVAPKNKKKNPKTKPKKTQQKKNKKSKKNVVDQEWHEGDIPETVFPEEPVFTMPDDVKSPLEYFRYYFDDELIDMIVHETNLYTTQQSGKSICVTSEEILAFFGIMIYMGVCSLPAAEDYWTLETRITQVCQVMPRNRYQQIHAKIHFHNNEEEGDDKLLKIRPLLDHMRQKCQGLEQDYQVSVDERMQGYKGTRAGSVRQYMPDKPSSRFGFKLFVLAAKNGMTLDFIPYTGQDTFDSENLTDEERALGVGAEAVISLCKCIRNPACTTVTIDNFYTGIPLITYLRDKMNLNSVGTIKRGRTLQCPLTDGDQLLAQGRGSYESYVNKDGIVVVQWADNKAVCLASSFVGLEPISTARRYSKEARAKIEVPCPKAVIRYNEAMGGVDLADMFMGIYKIPTRARRYYFSFIGYSLELALTNSWLQYKRDCKLLKIPKKKQIDSSKKFRLEVSEGLKTPLLRSLGEPSLDASLSKKKIKHPVVCRPNDSLRTDGYGHLPKYCDKGRCRYCKKGTSRMKCTKCGVVLCFNKDRNCFSQFHITKKGQLAPEDRVEQDEEDSEEMDEEVLEEIDEEDYDLLG